MGTLRSQVNITGQQVNGVTLGDPVAPVRADGTPAQPGDHMGMLFWAWDDSRIPTGVATLDGQALVITPDEAE